MTRNSRFIMTGCVLLGLAAPASTVIAEQSQSATQPPDKSQYTLLNPTPADQLRGMDTDRPNVTNSPHTIDAGHLQIETGVIDYTYDRSRFSGVTVRSDSFAFAQTDFRVGVLSHLEINAVIDPYEIDRAHDDNDRVTTYSRGFGDTTVGAKLSLWGDEGGDAVWQSALAIQPQFTFPTASGGVGDGHFEFAINAPFLINLPASFHLGLQTGIELERNASGDGDVAGFDNSISVDRVIVGSLDVYIEYASDVTTQKHVQAVQTIDVGGTYPLTDNIVLDGGLAFGLNNSTNDIEVLTGISLRF